VSKVRSTTLDVLAWDGPTLAMFEALGNTAVNSAFEARIYDARGAAARDDIFFSNNSEAVRARFSPAKANSQFFSFACCLDYVGTSLGPFIYMLANSCFAAMMQLL
jgi:hypothetical protein